MESNVIVYHIAGRIKTEAHKRRPFDDDGERSYFVLNQNVHLNPLLLSNFPSHLNKS